MVRLHHEYFAGLATDKKKIKVHQTSFTPALFVERAVLKGFLFNGNLRRLKWHL